MPMALSCTYAFDYGNDCGFAYGYVYCCTFWLCLLNGFEFVCPLTCLAPLPMAVPIYVNMALTMALTMAVTMAMTVAMAMSMAVSMAVFFFLLFYLCLGI